MTETTGCAIKRDLEKESQAGVLLIKDFSTSMEVVIKCQFAHFLHTFEKLFSKAFMVWHLFAATDSDGNIFNK